MALGLMRIVGYDMEDHWCYFIHGQVAYGLSLLQAQCRELKVLCLQLNRSILLLPYGWEYPKENGAPILAIDPKGRCKVALHSVIMMVQVSHEIGR